MGLHEEIQQLIIAYPNFKSPNPDGLLDVYEKNLSDIPDWLLAKAVAAHIRSSKFFPSVAELRELASNLANSDDVEYAQPKTEIPPWSKEVFWIANDLYMKWLYGEISDAELNRNVYWIAAKRRDAEMAADPYKYVPMGEVVYEPAAEKA